MPNLRHFYYALYFFLDINTTHSTCAVSGKRSPHPTHPKALLLPFKQRIREQIEPLVAEAGISEVSIKVGNRQNDIIRIIGLVGNTVLVDIATNAVNIHMCLFFITIPPFSVICKMANQLCITAQLIDLICPLQKAIFESCISRNKEQDSCVYNKAMLKFVQIKQSNTIFTIRLSATILPRPYY